MHGKNLREKVYFLAVGIRLHLKKYFLTAVGLLNKYDYCLSFPSIPEGLKAEKCTKGFRAVSIPIPDEIFKGCGVGILVKEEDLEDLVRHLERRGVRVSGIYRKNGGTFVEVKR